MADQLDQTDQQAVNLNSFAEMVGFPVELIKKELFNNQEVEEEFSMEQLREAMLKYIDNTMIND